MSNELDRLPTEELEAVLAAIGNEDSFERDTIQEAIRKRKQGGPNNDAFETRIESIFAAPKPERDTFTGLRTTGTSSNAAPPPFSTTIGATGIAWSSNDNRNNSTYLRPNSNANNNNNNNIAINRISFVDDTYTPTKKTTTNYFSSNNSNNNKNNLSTNAKKDDYKINTKPTKGAWNSTTINSSQGYVQQI